MQKSFKKQNDQTRLVTQISDNTKLIPNSQNNDLKRFKNKQFSVFNQNYKTNLLSLLQLWKNQPQIQKPQQIPDQNNQYQEQFEAPKISPTVNFKPVYRHQVDRMNQDVIVNQYTLSKLLGKGAQGIVKLGSDTKKVYAVKIINCEKLKKKYFVKKEELQQMISVQVNLLKKLDHPNIIKLYQALYSQESQKLFIILEYCSRGTFSNLINSKDQQQQQWINISKKYFREMASAMEYLSDKNIAHRDIKAQNVLVNQVNIVKLCDFNVSCYYKKNQLQNNLNFVGTKLYASPQLLSKKKDIKFDPFSADMWAFGITMYQFYQRKHPFASKSLGELEQIVQKKIQIPQSFDKVLKDLLGKMLQLDWKQRIKIKDLINHEYLR